MLRASFYNKLYNNHDYYQKVSDLQESVFLISLLLEKTSSTAYTTSSDVIQQPESVFDFDKLYVGISIVGLPGNVFTIVVLLSSATIRHKPVNIFIIHQSIIDFLACLTTILVTKYNPITVHYFGQGSGETFLCTMWVTRSLMWACFSASGYNLMFLTLERCWAITKPFQYNHAAVVKRLPYVFMFSWIMGFASIITNSIFNRVLDHRCIPFYTVQEAWMMHVIGASILMLACMVPAVVMIGVYVLIWISLQSTGNLNNLKSSKNLRKVQVNLLQTCITLMIMFVLCWTNHTIRFALRTGGYFPHLSRSYYPSTLSFIILNSCLNPFVYCVRYTEFQEQVKVLFCRRFIRITHNQSVSEVSRVDAS